MRRFRKMSAAMLAAVILVLNVGSNVYADNVNVDNLDIVCIDNASAEESTNEGYEEANEGEIIEKLEQHLKDIDLEGTIINTEEELKESLIEDMKNMIESYEYMLKEETDPTALEEIQNTIESLKAELAEYSINSVAESGTNDPKTKVDISTDSNTSKYFPAIRNQGSGKEGVKGKGSCQFFAMYYYMFSYEANRLNNKSSKDIANCYSPEWGYVQYFYNRDGIIDSLKNFGAVKWNEFVYNGEEGNDENLSGVSEDVLLKALETRLVDYEEIPITRGSSPIEGKDSKLIKEIKEVLDRGKPLYCVCCTSWSGGKAETGESIIVRFGVSTNTHALTIVGYDDSISYDVNGDGKIDDKEKGAFKVADSHGTGDGDGGYWWVLYDALNYESKIDKVDETKYKTTRYNGFLDYVGYFNVKVYRPKLIARLNFDGWDPDKTSVSWGPYVYLNRPEKIKKDDAIRLINRDTTVPFDKAVRLYDYAEYADTVDDLIGDRLFGVKVENNSEAGGNTKYFSNINCSLIDSKKNIIPTSKNVNQKNSFDITKNDEVLFRTSLNLGDIDYDKKITDSDAQTVLKIASGINTNSSNLQLLLADYNRDGKVDLKDAQAVNKVKQ